jgi:hypothetical protein
MTGSGVCGAVSVWHTLIHVLKLDFTVHGGPLRILTLVRPSVLPACACLPALLLVCLFVRCQAFLTVCLPVCPCHLC